MQLHERQIRRRLEEDFGPLINMSDMASHGEDTIAKARLSRGLAALTVAANAKISVEESCQSVVDESGDAGIDAIGVAIARNEVYVVQAKTSPGAPSPTEVMKFTQGIRYLLDWDWDSLGAKTRKRKEEIADALESNVKVIAIYSHLGSQGPTEEAKKISEQLLKDVNSSGDILDFRYQGLRENFENRNIASGLGSPDYELVFDRWVTMSDYRSEIMGIVAGDQLASMIDSFSERLFDKNIRAVLRSTATNDKLDETIRTSPSDFWYYNNGITIVANAITSSRTNPRSADESFSLKGLSVVNGAQTCGALGRAFRDGVSLDDVRVTVRVISTEGQSEDFEKHVTRYTNTQNQITNREFVSLDPYQQELSEILLAEGIQYQFRTGQELDNEGFDFAFDLEEATRALACMTGVGNATLAKREISRLWSDLYATPYLEIFPRNLDAAEMYNAVLFWRQSSLVFDSIGAEMEPREKGIITNSRYMACTLLMQSVRTSGIRFSDFEWDIESWFSDNKENVKSLVECILELHEKENSGGFPMSFFKNQKKVEAFAGLVRNRWQLQGA